MGDALNTVTTSDGSITTAKLAGSLSVGLAAGTNSAPSLYFTGDSNTGVYSPGADQVAVTTGGTQRLSIDSSGNVNIDSNTLYVDAANNRVGLGTSSAGDILHVKGGSTYAGVIADNSAATGGGAFRAYRNGVQKAIFCADSWVTGTSSDDAAIYADAGGGVKFYTNNSSTAKAVLTSGGSLGIGTTSVNTTLEVQNSSTPIIRVGDGTRHMELRGGSTTQNAAIGTNYNGGFDIIQNGNAAVTIDTSKRVLVGTSSARNTFINQTYVPIVQIEGVSANNPNGLSIVTNTNDDNPAWIYLGKSRGTVVGSNTAVQSGDVLGSIAFSGANGTDISNTAAWIRCAVDGTPGVGDMPGRLVFFTTADGASSPTERLRLTAAGLFQSMPIYNTTGGDAANVVVNSSGTVYRSTSSAKYKTDIETLQDEFADSILELRPVWYRSTCAIDNPDWSYWGFIAEEVAEIDPRLVSWKTSQVTFDDKGSAVQVPCDPEPEGVQYDRFVPHLLNLIKRQKEQIEAQSTAIAALEARLSALEGQ
jgi:hypothetical protein